MEERSEAECGAYSPLGGCDAGRVLNAEINPRNADRHSGEKDAAGWNDETTWAKPASVFNSVV